MVEETAPSDEEVFQNLLGRQFEEANETDVANALSFYEMLSGKSFTVNVHQIYHLINSIPLETPGGRVINSRTTKKELIVARRQTIALKQIISSIRNWLKRNCVMGISHPIMNIPVGSYFLQSQEKGVRAYLSRKLAEYKKYREELFEVWADEYTIAEDAYIRYTACMSLEKYEPFGVERIVCSQMQNQDLFKILDSFDNRLFKYSIPKNNDSSSQSDQSKSVPQQISDLYRLLSHMLEDLIPPEAHEFLEGCTVLPWIGKGGRYVIYYPINKEGFNALNREVFRASRDFSKQIPEKLPEYSYQLKINYKMLPSWDLIQNRLELDIQQEIDSRYLSKKQEFEQEIARIDNDFVQSMEEEINRRKETFQKIQSELFSNTVKNIVGRIAQVTEKIKKAANSGGNFNKKGFSSLYFQVDDERLSYLDLLMETLDAFPYSGTEKIKNKVRELSELFTAVDEKPDLSGITIPENHDSLQKYLDNLVQELDLGLEQLSGKLEIPDVVPDINLDMSLDRSDLAEKRPSRSTVGLTLSLKE